MVSTCRMAVLGLLCVVIAACGGGGGGGSENNGGGGGGGGPSGPNNPGQPPLAPVPNAFLPTDTALGLTYTTLPAHFEATINRNSVFVAPYLYPTGGKEYYVSTPDEVSLAGFFSPQVVVSGAGTFTADARFSTPVTLFRNDWLPQRGDTVSGAGTVTILPTYNDQALTYSGTTTYFGPEEITTPLGTFSAKHVRVDLTVSATVQGTTFTVPFRVELWFARNVGIVQRSEAGQVLMLQQVVGPDADGDTVFDGLDAFPSNATETRDFDGDGVGDNSDPDDDGDNVADVNDKFPRNKKESADSDNDGAGDVADLDDDNDGLADVVDPFPYDIHNDDTDKDGIADYYDGDDDNDGFIDAVDRFPLNAAEWVDTDNDSLGNNGDVDDDNDGYYDLADAYPLNPKRFQQLNVDITSRALNAVFGSAAMPATWFNVTSQGTDWQATSSVPWVHVQNTSGSGPTLVTISTDTQGLAVGTHTARVTVTDPETGRSVDVNVQLTVVLPELTASVGSVSFDGKYGWGTVSKPVDVSLNTGLTSYPVTIDVSFAATGAISGVVVGGTVGGSNPSRLNVLVDPAKLHAGKHTGQLTLTANVQGQMISRTIAVEALASSRVLYPSSEAVAFSKIAADNVFSRKVKILDSYGLDGTAWTATHSGESWIDSVTPSGVSGGELTVTINAIGLPDGVHRGTVTLAAAGVDTVVPIQVSVYVNSAVGPNTMTQAAVYKQIASDPLRPYVYAHNVSSVIDVWHAYTGTLVGTITGITGSPGEMIASSDGKWLFVQDSVSGGVTRINLDTRVVDAVWPLTDASNSFAKNAINFVRPNGHPVLLLSDRRYVDANTGAVLGEVAMPTVSSLDLLASTFDGRIVCGVTKQATPFNGFCVEPKYGDYDNAPGAITANNAGISGHDAGGGFATDMAITADGKGAFVTIMGGANAMYGFPLSPSGNGGTLVTLNGLVGEEGRGVTTALDSGIYMNQLTAVDDTERLRGWNDNGSSLRINSALGSASAIQPLQSQLVTSGDTRVVAFLIGTTPSPTVSTELRFIRW